MESGKRRQFVWIGQQRIRLFWLGLSLMLISTGCRSFLAGTAMKNYPIKVKPIPGLASPNKYQADFLYLKTLGEQVVPLEDRYFPPDKRAAMEGEILRTLDESDCSRQTFVWCLQRYLAAFNNEHACIVDDPGGEPVAGLYPFRVHYVTNILYLSDIASNYDHALIGREITAINGRPVPEVEQKLFGMVVGAENIWMKRKALEPSGYSLPTMYRLAGLASSVSNRLRLEFTDHAPVEFPPIWKNNVKWQRVPRQANLLTGRSPHNYDCQILPGQKLAYFQFNVCFDKTAILDGLDMVNGWVRPLVRLWLAFEFRKKEPDGPLRGIYDPGRPILKDYLTVTMRDINRQGITNLILDLRHNNGGERELCYQLLYYLTSRTNLLDSKVYEYNPKVYAYYDPEDSKDFESWYLKKFGKPPQAGHLLPTEDEPFFSNITDPNSAYYVPQRRPVFQGQIIVLANQGTDSAASFLAGLMQDNRLGLIVGTSTGNNPTGPTSLTPFLLPHSGIMISLPTEYFVRAQPSNGDVLEPDYWVENSMADLDTGRDAAFEKALDLLHLSGTISTERIAAAQEYLHDLKQKNQLPGWSKNESGAARLEAYSGGITVSIRKRGYRSIYHYTLVQAPGNGGWKLQKAWRTDQNGHIAENYPLE